MSLEKSTAELRLHLIACEFIFWTLNQNLSFTVLNLLFLSFVNGRLRYCYLWQVDRILEVNWFLEARSMFQYFCMTKQAPNAAVSKE
jgi:uncharacterized protein YybS (DUF2232 family)